MDRRAAVLHPSPDSGCTSPSSPGSYPRYETSSATSTLSIESSSTPGSTRSIARTTTRTVGSWPTGLRIRATRARAPLSSKPPRQRTMIQRMGLPCMGCRAGAASRPSTGGQAAHSNAVALHPQTSPYSHALDPKRTKPSGSSTVEHSFASLTPSHFRAVLALRTTMMAEVFEFRLSPSGG